MSKIEQKLSTEKTSPKILVEEQVNQAQETLENRIDTSLVSQVDSFYKEVCFLCSEGKIEQRTKTPFFQTLLESRPSFEKSFGEILKEYNSTKPNQKRKILTNTKVSFDFSTLTSLEYLVLVGGTSLTSLENLKGYALIGPLKEKVDEVVAKKLKFFFVDRINDFNLISSMEDLEELYVANNCSFSLEPLLKLKKLRVLLFEQTVKLDLSIFRHHKNLNIFIEPLCIKNISSMRNAECLVNNKSWYGNQVENDKIGKEIKIHLHGSEFSGKSSLMRDLCDDQGISLEKTKETKSKKASFTIGGRNIICYDNPGGNSNPFISSPFVSQTIHHIVVFTINLHDGRFDTHLKTIQDHFSKFHVIVVGTKVDEVDEDIIHDFLNEFTENPLDFIKGVLLVKNKLVKKCKGCKEFSICYEKEKTFCKKEGCPKYRFTKLHPPAICPTCHGEIKEDDKNSTWKCVNQNCNAFEEHSNYDSFGWKNLKDLIEKNIWESDKSYWRNIVEKKIKDSVEILERESNNDKHIKKSKFDLITEFSKIWFEELTLFHYEMNEKFDFFLNLFNEIRTYYFKESKKKFLLPFGLNLLRYCVLNHVYSLRKVKTIELMVKKNAKNLESLIKNFQFNQNISPESTKTEHLTSLLLQYFEEISKLDYPNIWSLKSENFKVQEKNSSLTLFQDGKETFQEIYSAIKNSNEFVVILGWMFTHTLKLVKSDEYKALNSLLMEKAEKGVKIFILVWEDHRDHLKTGNSKSKTDLEDLKHDNINFQFVGNDENSSNILFSIYSHHQKCVLCDDNGKYVGFLGGLDLASGRYDTPEHTVFHKDFKDDYYSPGGTFRQPWHDIHCKVEGKIFEDLYLNFTQRWNFHLKDKPTDKIYSDLPILKSNNLDIHQNSNWNIQLFRSISLENENVQSVYDLYLNSIRNAEEFIYIENQYFHGSGDLWEESEKTVTNQIPKFLVDKIIQKLENDEPFMVYIMHPLHPEGNRVKEDMFDVSASVVANILHFQWQTKLFMFTKIQEAINLKKLLNPNFEGEVQDYIDFYYLRKFEIVPKTSYLMDVIPESHKEAIKQLKMKNIFSCPIYVHSKMMVVDDRFIIIGSANINERSLISGDSEICIGAFELNGTDISLFRKKLFVEHFGNLDQTLIDSSPNEQNIKLTVRELAKKNAEFHEKICKDPKINSIETNGNVCQLLKWENGILTLLKHADLEEYLPQGRKTKTFSTTNQMKKFII
jgi:phosphatidylserine/phosphatidylglycerophosphate/cardiolipin synthase-like enzyme